VQLRVREVTGQDDVTSLRGGGHHDRVDDAWPRRCPRERLAGEAREGQRERLDLERLEGGVPLVRVGHATTRRRRRWAP
jgi:hypothetical protein